MSGFQGKQPSTQISNHSSTFNDDGFSYLKILNYNSIIPPSLGNDFVLLTQNYKSNLLFPTKTPTQEYLSIRKEAILYIKDIINALNYSKTVLYKTILYLDIYCLHKSLYNINIYQISTICIFIALQFNECCVNNNINELFVLLKLIPRLLELEQDILKTLNFDLGMLTVYDYINLYFTKGVLFTNNPISKEDLFEVEFLLAFSVDLLWLLIDDDRFLDFTPQTLALTIIRIATEKNSVSFDNKLFQLAYNINFKQMNHVQCFFVIKTILPYIIKETHLTNMNKHSNLNANNLCISNSEKASNINYSVSPEHPSSSTLDSIYSSQ